MLTKLSAKIVHVHCECSADVSAERFVRRKRHRGHLDQEKSHAEIQADIQEVASLGRLKIGLRIDVDTSQKPDLDVVLQEVCRALRMPHADD